jgi:hypothetical protein
MRKKRNWEEKTSKNNEKVVNKNKGSVS